MIPDYLKQDHPPRGFGEVGPEDLWVEPLDRYLEALRDLPDSGGGGCHAALLGVANRGRIAKLTEDRIFSDLRARVRDEARTVSDNEIRDAIRKAFSTTFIPQHRQKILVDGKQAFERISERGRKFDVALLAELSPVAIDWKENRDAIEILKRLYAPSDLLFLGEKYHTGREYIRTAGEWIRRFERGCPVPPHLVLNPLSGKLGKTKDGKGSYRSDSCVAQFKFVTVEFDKVPLEKQIQFYGGAPLPVVALVHSGNKSVHAWVRADAANAAEWAQQIEVESFDLLTPMGADRSCKNESRLSRLPGHFRREKRKWQRLLYLNPDGAPLQP